MDKQHAYHSLCQLQVLFVKRSHLHTMRLLVRFWSALNKSTSIRPGRVNAASSFSGWFVLITTLCHVAVTGHPMHSEDMSRA